MPTILFIRHGDHSLLGKKIAGRMPGVHLNEDGQRQAQELPGRLVGIPISAIYSSPLERAQETAQPTAESFDLPIQTVDELNEIDFGDWTAMGLDELHHLPKWQLFNSFRCGTRIPNGELMPEVQTRVVGFLERLCTAKPDDVVAIFSHADTIKAALAYFLGTPLDLFLRIEVFPASVSIVRLTEHGPKILCLNHLDSVSDIVAKHS